MPRTVSFEDLESALMWVSSPPEFEAAAFVSRTTGRIYSRGPDGPVEDDYPSDIEDGTEYIAVPHKNELDLGSTLVFHFVDERAPSIAAEVRDAFRRKGAYSRFKTLLVRHQLLETWHEYENEATAQALERWAQDQGFRVIRGRASAEGSA
jgi:hypothetical protein